MLDTKMLLIIVVHLYKKGLDETQAAIDFVSAHQLDSKVDEPARLGRTSFADGQVRSSQKALQKGA